MEIKLNKEAINSTYKNTLINDQLIIHTPLENITNKLRIPCDYRYNTNFELPEKVKVQIKRNKIAIAKAKRNINILKVVQKTLNKISHNLQKTKELTFEDKKIHKVHHEMKLTEILINSKEAILKIDPILDSPSNHSGNIKNQLADEIDTLISNLSLTSIQISTYQEKLEKVIRSLSISIENLESIDLITNNVSINSNTMVPQKRTIVKRTA